MVPPTVRGALLGAGLLFAAGCHRPPTRTAPSVGGELPAAPSPVDVTPYVSLTAADGTGLALVAMDARAVVDDPIAFTELHLTFENPADRVLEGRFRLVLPSEAAISRLAMRVDGAWQEGEVVEKQRAREAYEDALHRRQDPLLLEQAAGNELSARVFPIRAHERKEIVVAWSEDLGRAAYRLPLRGLPAIGHLHVAATRSGEALAVKTLDLRATVPTKDFVLEPSGERSEDGIRAGGLAVVRLKPEVPLREDPLRGAIVLFDTSASRALGLREQARVLADLATRQGDARWVVLAFDQEVEPIFDGPASRFGSAELERLLARGALGASNIAAALSWAADAATRSSLTRVVVMTDGVATAGEVDLSRRVKTLRAAGVERLDAIAFGGVRDEPALARIVSVGLPRNGVVVDGTRGPEEIAQRLGRGVSSNLVVDVPGARWVHPSRLDGFQYGDEVVVHAELGEQAEMSVRIGDAPVRRLTLRNAERPLVERSWARAKVANLLDGEARGEGDLAKTHAQIVRLSVDHRVLTPHTALVVLESEEDYQRFGLARRALSDVLSVDGGRVVRTRHVMPKLPPKVGGTAPIVPRGLGARGNMWGDAIGDAFGAGGLGLSGTGEGGGGQGAERSAVGRVGGASAAAEPRAVLAPGTTNGAPMVSGRVAPEIIQRVVRQNYGRFRACYEVGLRSASGLSGRVAIRFVIRTDGSVGDAVDGGSDLPDTATIACIARVFTTLTFPRPDGVVRVVYPLVFQPGDGVAAAPPPARSATPESSDPWSGTFKEVMSAIARARGDQALAIATKWHDSAPGDVLALVALGEARESLHDTRGAARAYGSLVDLFPDRADLRRFAGERLERLETIPAVHDLVVDTYARAAKDRPDHPASHRLLAFARLKGGDHAGAIEALIEGIKQPYPAGRFAGVTRILREDLGLVGAVWLAKAPSLRSTIETRLRTVGAKIDDQPSLRFVLNWETDANDVDFHVFDGTGAHAFFSNPELPTGGSLYADVTTGYGPECFTVPGPKSKRHGPYFLQAHYLSRGPMGYGMGKLQIIDHDGKGHLAFDERPFVVMNDRAFVDLGEYDAK